MKNVLIHNNQTYVVDIALHLSFFYVHQILIYWNILLIENNHYDETYDVVDKDPNAMLKGATTGGAIGLLAGLGLLLIPGVGPILASGPLLAALTGATAGAAVGATAGTLLGLLKDEGIPNDHAEKYAKHFDDGDILVFVGAEENQVGALREVFIKYKALTVDNF